MTGATAPTDLTVRISDLAGRPIRTLRGSPRVGQNEWFWNGTSDDGAKLPNGVYLYQIDGVDLPTPGSVHLTGRVILNR
ncbi:FlgD immunoglobulin-like domain containing protein [Spirosoma litoris]